jgi:hypothetical protein
VQNRKQAASTGLERPSNMLGNSVLGSRRGNLSRQSCVDCIKRACFASKYHNLADDEFRHTRCMLPCFDACRSECDIVCVARLARLGEVNHQLNWVANSWSLGIRYDVIHNRAPPRAVAYKALRIRAYKLARSWIIIDIAIMYTVCVVNFFVRWRMVRVLWLEEFSVQGEA